MAARQNNSALLRVYENREFSSLAIQGRTVYQADDAGERLLEKRYPIVDGRLDWFFEWPYKPHEMLIDDGSPARIFTVYEVDSEMREHFRFTLFYEPDPAGIYPKSVAYQLRKKSDEKANRQSHA
jgi:hypothetical protein